MKNIILEGCDCVGKTTIANTLLNIDDRFELVKRNQPKTMNEFKYMCFSDVEKLNNNENLIYDRGLLGECIYAPLKRGYYPDYMRELENSIENTLLVLVTADIEAIKERFDNEFITKDDLLHVRNQYLNEFYLSNYKNKMIVDTTIVEPFIVANYIYKKIL